MQNYTIVYCFNLCVWETYFIRWTNLATFTHAVFSYLNVIPSTRINYRIKIQYTPKQVKIIYLFKNLYRKQVSSHPLFTTLNFSNRSSFQIIQEYAWTSTWDEVPLYNRLLCVYFEKCTFYPRALNLFAPRGGHADLFSRPFAQSALASPNAKSNMLVWACSADSPKVQRRLRNNGTISLSRSFLLILNT